MTHRALLTCSQLAVLPWHRDLNRLDNAKGAKATDGASKPLTTYYSTLMLGKASCRSLQFAISNTNTSMVAELGFMHHAALLNYETVSYFCNQKLERDNFATAIADYQVKKSVG